MHCDDGGGGGETEINEFLLTLAILLLILGTSVYFVVLPLSKSNICLCMVT